MSGRLEAGVSRETRGAVTLLHLPLPAAGLDPATLAQLTARLEEIDRADQARAVVLTGPAGAWDLPPAGGPGLTEALAWLNRAVITLRRLARPVVAGLAGPARGGGLALVLAADLVAAEATASLAAGDWPGAPCPVGGASALVARLAGHKRASRFFLAGLRLSAAEAQAWGLVNEAVPPGAAPETALTWAQDLAGGPVQALAAAKALLHRAVWGDLETILEEERRAACRLAGGSEAL
ncbi:MAG: enoyl-CoA hydratase/isomerase family protein [Deltaproteobacteria bacterium]|nr:enoyl-CoA hydratase/isomerase family protein [Deltaproteobacteria bacterium]